jgi:outer membrane protein OmpA-like peptidoglycan-associated protein
MAVSPPEQSKAAGVDEPSALEQSANSVQENAPEGTPGKSATISDQLEPGTLFAWFGLQRELGIGSTGTIWLAKDYSLKRHANQVALRFLPDIIAGDETAVERLKQEIRRRAALKHPNIPRVYDLIENKGRVAIQMEYLDGQSLSRLRLRKLNQVFEVADLEKWIRELCEALEYAHKNAGFNDFDIVPDNLIVDGAGNFKLKDFGIGSCITDSIGGLLAVQDTSDTLPYMSPQRIKGQERTITDDVYSLGATIYELLTGKPPFYSGDITAQVNEENLPSMTQRRAELGISGEPIPKNWEETVAACLAKDPIQRPQRVIEVERRLTNAAAQPDILPSSKGRSLFCYTAKRQHTTKQQPPDRTRPYRKTLLPVGGIVFILALVSAVVLLSSHKVAGPGPGRIVLNTIPSEATVFLDGEARGITPLVIENVAPGDHQLRIELEDYKPETSIVSVNKGDQKYFRLIHLVRLPFVTRATAPSRPGSAGGQSLSGSKLSPEAGPASSPQAGPASSPQAGPASSPQAGPAPSPEAGLTPSLEVNPTPSAEASPTPSTQETANPGPRQSAPPAPSSQLDFDAIRKEVIERINALPGVTAAKKAAMIENMHKARSMERLTVIHFNAGQTALRKTASGELVKTFASPEMRDKLSDPTIILVIAGYADTGGRADLNLRFSQERAENVSKILKEQARLLNAMRTAGMGGTQLLDSRQPDQNRAVEVWAVVP